ncbi:MAG: TonB-dependent receptor [Bacteroidetes bacterium]|nr:TonB-dependent receptor [Bacteroidota bacterium]
MDAENAEPAPFQPVRLVNEDIGFEGVRTTNDQGKVRFEGLSTAGRYRIELASGIMNLVEGQQELVLVSGRTSSLTLAVSERNQLLQAVSISAYERQDINTVNAQVASELTARELSLLPVEGRDITRSLYRLPNITQATGFYPEAPNVAINGANSLYTSYQIDGLDNNENFLGGQRFAMPVGFTRNITALTNNFSAEHGLTNNGIINITSQSGTNTWTGEVFYLTRPGELTDASSPYAQRDLSGNQVRDGFMRHQGGFSVGGPLRRDKTFLFLNLEHTADFKDNLLNVPQLGINETVAGNNSFTYLSARLDQHWSSNWHSSLRVNGGSVSIERQGGGLEGGVTFPSAGNTQTRRSLNAALKNTYTGDKLTYEANYQFGAFDWNYAAPEDEGLPQVTVLDPVGQTVAVLGHPGYVFDENEQTHVVQQKGTWTMSRHTVKAGGEFRHSSFALFGGGNPNGNYTVQLTDMQLAGLSGLGTGLLPADLPSDVDVLNYSVELRPTSFGDNQIIGSVYLEDEFRATNKLSLSLGLRYDVDNLSEGGGEDLDLNNIAPRFSANYQLSERSALRLGYGIYYNKIIYAIVSDALQFNSTSAGYRAQLQALIDQGILPASTDLDAVTNEGNLSANVPGVPYLGGPLPAELQAQRDQAFQNELRILNPEGYDNPYSHQFMLGYQHKVNAQSLFYVDLMHNRSYDLFRLRDLNAPAAYPIDPDNVVVRPQSEADASRPVPVFSDASGVYSIVNGDTLRGISRNVMVTETDGRSNYYAANFTWQKARGSDNWALRLMYTLSFLENNTEDINFRAMDANDFEAEWGPSINDRTHLINAIASYFPVQRLTVTMAGLLQSGQPINRVPDGSLYGTTDLNGDGRSFGDAYVGNSDRAPGEARNSDRLPWASTFDASVFYEIPLGKSADGDADVTRLELGASVFNLFNAENLTGYSNNATQSNQVQPGPASSGVLIRRNAAPPRQFQFSLRWFF